MSLISFLFRRFSSIEKKLLETGVARTVKNNILKIEGIEGLKKGDIVDAGEYKAWVFALYRDYSLAAVLSEKNISFNGEVTLNSSFELKAPNTKSPSVKSGMIIGQNVEGNSIKQFLKTPPPRKHLTCTEQLFTGYQQIDLCQPLSIGQSILLYGKTRKGKTKLAYQTAELFAKRENSKVVIVSPNPSKPKNPLPNCINYSSPSESSDLSAYLLPYIALSHACSLRDQGHEVLFLIDDIQYHAFKEKSLFPAEKLIDASLSNLIFEHSKALSTTSSLTSIIILDESVSDETHSRSTLSLRSNLLSLCSSSINFESKHPLIAPTQPTLDFIRPIFSDFPYQLPILKSLRGRLMKIFGDLKEMQDTETIKEKLGMNSDPWDKYLLLDSSYFISLLCQDSQISTHELVCYIELVLYSIEKEMISRFNIEMKQVRIEFFKFLKTCSSEGLASLMKDPKNLDVDRVINDIDENVIKHFFVECKMQGWLKEFQDDYEELYLSSSVSSQTTLKTEVQPEKAPEGKRFIERIFRPPT